MHPKEDQERQPLLSGHRSNYSAVPQEGMQTQTREVHAGTSDTISSTAVDVDHLLDVSATPRDEPPHDTPEPATASASLLTPSTTQQHLHKNVNTSSSPTLSSTVDPRDAAGVQAARLHRLYRQIGWTIGLALIFILLTFIVSPLVAQRVLDHALVLRIQQTEISAVDDEGFAVHIKSSVSLDPSHDGVFGLTKWAQYLEPELTIEPTTLHLVMPHTSLTTLDVGLGPDRERQQPHYTTKDRRGISGRLMGSFHVPQQVLQMRKGATLLEITTHVNVTDASALASFFQLALAESVLELGVQGQLRTHTGKLWPLNLQLTRIVPVEGMKGIQDATLVSMALPSDDPQGGVTIEGVARLRNPSSSLSVDLGKLTFGVYLSSDDQSLLHTADSSDLRHQYKVAELFCSHVELKAHETVDLAVIGRLLHMDDWVPVSPVLTALHILKSEKQFLLSRLLSRYIQGEDSVVAIRALPEPEMAHWLQVVVQSIALSVRFPGSPQKDFIEGIDMKQLSFGFDGNDTHPPSNSAEIRGRLTARLQLPKNVTFPITVAKLYPEVELSPLAPSDDSDDDARSWQAGFTPMARIVLPGSLPAKSTQNGNALQVDVSLESGKLVILPGREQAFYGFLNDSFTQDEITLGVTGQAKALVETGMGSFELGPIPFVTRTTQKGLGGLMGVPPKLEQIDIVDSTNRSLTIKARLMINNPSSISASLGSLSFFWGYNGFLVGLATVPSAVLQPGPNTVETIGMMDPLLDCRQRAYDPMCDPEEAAQAARAFLSGYISGDNTTAIDILGHEESTKIPLLHPLISSLRIRSTLPVMEQEFLLSTTMYLLSSMIVLELRNPLDTTIWILNINGTAFYKDEPLGHIRVNFERDIATPKPIEIPANDHQGENSGYVKTPRLPVSYELSSVGYEALKQALGGTLEVDVLCHIKARVGNMVQWIDYQKANVTANVRRGLF